MLLPDTHGQSGFDGEHITKDLLLESSRVNEIIKLRAKADERKPFKKLEKSLWSKN